MPNRLLKEKKIAVFLQARIHSSRLPEKLFFSLAGKSVLQRIIDRVLTLKRYLDYIAVLVPSRDMERVQSHLQPYPEIIIFPGSEENVLKRFADANQVIKADIIIRMTADNPLVDLYHLKKALVAHINNNADITFYDNLALGTGVEVFNKSSLELCLQKASQPHHFEHVTPYIRENPELFHIQKLHARGIYNHPEIRLTIDEKDDYLLMQKIYDALYKRGVLSLKQVLKYLLQNPSLPALNAHVRQKTLK